MKAHKFFACMTVCCMVLTICTGYGAFGGKKNKTIEEAAADVETAAQDLADAVAEAEAEAEE